ncbi:MAG: transposase [Thaumarchaeota archaeon]|nr:transposase [Nitrososphaerota archaeon]MDE1841254.1 transposase [Nitrososphaerota archaeon]MDE1877633.1 transposase [Nitrososphaerota archaeon]
MVYSKLGQYNVLSYYKLHAISKAVEILSKKETRETSILCLKCGKRLQEQGTWKNSDWNRELWCESCQRWLDRDVVAIINQSLPGLSRFDSSKVDANKVVKRNMENMPLILQVDA